MLAVVSRVFCFSIISSVAAYADTPQQPFGTARLELHVPSGSNISINGRRLRRTNFDKHRSVLLTNVPAYSDQIVTIRVSRTKQNCDCGFSTESSCACGFKTQSCCKVITVRAGDHQYVSFDNAKTKDGSHPPKELNFKVISPRTYDEVLTKALSSESN